MRSKIRRAEPWIALVGGALFCLLAAISHVWAANATNAGIAYNNAFCAAQGTGVYALQLQNGTTADANQVQGNLNDVLSCLSNILAATSTVGNIFLTAATAAPTVSPYTMPTGTIAVSSLLYASANNVISALTPCANGVVEYNGSSAPSCVAAISFPTDFSVNYANTGANTFLQVQNAGTSSNASTIAKIAASLSCASCFVLLDTVGGATPTVNLSAAAGMTGGMLISTGAGAITLAPSASLFATGLTASAGGGADTALCYKAATHEIQTGPC